MADPVPRRRILGYVLAAPILVTAAELTVTATAAAQSPSSAVTKLLGLNEIMTAAALPATGLVSIEVSQDGTVSFVLPRATLGQGTASSTARLIADELSIPRKRVHLTPAAIQPDSVLHRLTGGSDAIVSTYSPIRVAAAVARQRLLEAASAAFDSPVAYLRLHAGLITDDGSGRSLDIGAVARSAASKSTLAVTLELSGGSYLSGGLSGGERAGRPT